MDKSFESLFQLYVRIESSYFAYIDKFYGNKFFLYLFHRFIEICETHLFPIFDLKMINNVRNIVAFKQTFDYPMI